MQITRKSLMTGKVRTLDLPITPEQWAEYAKGKLIQYALPHLTDGQREFIITGITDDEWDSCLGNDDDEDEEYA